MKRHALPLIVSLLTFSLFSTYSTAASTADDLVLARDGQTDYVIVLPDEPTPVQQSAAHELQSHLKQVTGAEFAMTSESKAPAGKPRIIIGPSPLAEKLVPDFKPDTAKDDEIVVRTVGQDLVLTGHLQRGPLYAVYTLLEDTIGCRWWTSTESYIPNRPTLTIGPIDHRYAPKLIYREAYYLDAFNGLFATRLKCNGNSARISPEYGGHHRFAMFVHTFNRLIPPEKYFDDHPEWFSEIGGKRMAERSQLCLTNEEVLAELTRNAKETLRANPDATFLSISQNDWHGRCQCEKCMKVEAEEGSPSGPLIRLVNQVAEEIEREFPHVWVETLAYQYTRKPPKLARPRDNVVIRLCTIECSFAQPLGQGPQNASLREDIEGWSEIAPHLFIWDYVTNFHGYMLPHPNLRVLGPNVRFFVDHGTIGLFEQGDSTCAAGEFVQMRAWVLAHLMWDPSRDANSLIEEFMTGYYGPAAPRLLAYQKLIHDRAEATDVYLRCFMGDTSTWLDVETLSEATALFDKAAQAVAAEPVLSRRVEMARLSLDHVWLKRYFRLRRAAAIKGIPFAGPKDPKAAVEAFIEKLKRYDVKSYREHTNYYPLQTYLTDLAGRFGTPAAPPAICRDLPERDWIDFQEGEMNLSRTNNWVKPVDDQAASNKRAARMPGDHNAWAVQLRLPGDFGQLEDEPADEELKWHCYAAVRCAAAGENVTGTAMRVGIYDLQERRGVVTKDLTVADIAGDEYQVIDLGTHRLDDGMYIWAAPPKRPGEIEAVYVDRFFIVRETN